MEFLAESIGLLDMDGSSVGNVVTPKNKPAHNISAAANNTSFSSINSIDGERRQNNQDGGLKKSPPRHAECDCCSKKTFNLALENLSDMESCCRCDCQRNDGQIIDDADEFVDFSDEGTESIFDDDGDAVHSDESILYNEEEFIAIESKSSSPSNKHNVNNTDSTQLTRLVTQRIDARTNFNCFTGNVDAVTGELIHGTLVYRITGEVYEGPFVSGPRQNQNQSILVQDYINFENGSVDTTSAAQFETVSLRHGSNATSHYPNGMTFTGTYELDHPKFGKWIMKDNDGIEEWMYEGPLIVAAMMDDTSSLLPSCSVASALNNTPHRRKSPSTSSANTTPINSAPSSGNITTASLSTNRVIGTSNPLPGSVLFHGIGTYVRYSDGMRYKGEFDHGLADGVGKEIIPNFGGDGESVYQGEFVNGWRHGVGTLMEDVVVNDDDDDDMDNSEEEGDEYCEQCHRILLTTDEEYDGTENGPDFAAGGSNQQDEDHQLDDEYNTRYDDDEITTGRSQSASLLSQPVSKSCSACVGRTSSPRPRRKQRYSSGVWCAGQFEVQDVVGIVSHSSDGRKEFVEDSTPSVMSAGTTWDLLPEKWLGLG